MEAVKDHKERKVLQEQVRQKEQKVCKVQEAQLVTKANKVHKEHKVLQEQVRQKEPKVCKAQEV